MRAPASTLGPSRPRALVVPARRLPALLGALAWIAVVVVYYGSLLMVEPTATGGPMAAAPIGYRLALWAFPLLIVPHLVGSLRAIATPRRLVFDADARAVLRDGRRVAGFEELGRLQLRAVNGACEDLALVAMLKDGAELDIESGARRPVAALADELAAFVGVAVEARG